MKKKKDMVKVGTPLTPEEIQEIDEINADKLSVEATLQIAMTYASNRLTKLREHETQWWNRALVSRGLDIGPQYHFHNTGPIVRIEKEVSDD